MSASAAAVPICSVHSSRRRMCWWRAGCLAAGLAISPSWLPAAADVLVADLVVHARGFTHDRGQAVASLFREGDDIFIEPRLRVMAKVQGGNATLVFPRMEYGHYAVLVFHDENGNDDLDHNILRFPAEPLGYSNDFEFGLFSGLPSFEKLRFTLGADTRPIEITVR